MCFHRFLCSGALGGVFSIVKIDVEKVAQRRDTWRRLGGERCIFARVILERCVFA